MDSSAYNHFDFRGLFAAAAFGALCFLALSVGGVAFVAWWLYSHVAFV